MFSRARFPFSSSGRVTQRLAELTAHINELERVEEALIETAHAQDLDILRRSDASPAVVLSVTVAKKQKVEPAA